MERFHILINVAQIESPLKEKNVPYGEKLNKGYFFLDTLYTE